MSDRRAFLASLAALPMLGGGVKLIGSPTAAAVPVTENLLDSYQCWLTYERSFLMWERFGGNHLDEQHAPDLSVMWYDRKRDHLFDCIPMANPAGSFNHMGTAGRAAVILSAAGVPLTDRRRL